MQTQINKSQLAATFSDRVEKVSKRVVIETLNEVILGEFHHRPHMRLIDEMISGEQYMAITNAVIYDRNGKVRFRTKFLSLNCDHIVLIIPWEEMERRKDTHQFDP